MAFNFLLITNIWSKMFRNSKTGQVRKCFCERDHRLQDELGHYVQKRTRLWSRKLETREVGREANVNKVLRSWWLRCISIGTCSFLVKILFPFPLVTAIIIGDYFCNGLSCANGLHLIDYCQSNCLLIWLLQAETEICILMACS